MRTKYQDLIQMKCKDLSKAMEDMTYLYKETKVPSSHYEKIMKETVEEDFAQIVQTNVLNAYYSTIKSVYDDNPKAFLQVMVCLQKKIKPSDLRTCEHLALNVSIDEFLNTSKNKPQFMNTDLMERYEDIVENGLMNSENEEFDIDGSGGGYIN